MLSNSVQRSSLFVLSIQLLLLLVPVLTQNHSSSSSSPLVNKIDVSNYDQLHHRCLHPQKLALLQLKRDFSIRRSFPESYSKLDSWDTSTNCCSWDGITCDVATGHVIGLDLSNGFLPSNYARIRGGWIESSLIFSSLGSLQRLNLSHNEFYNQPIPLGLGQLSNLTHLDLSDCFFIGQVPKELSKLSKLVHLDLSGNFLMDVQPIPSWLGMLFNLSHLRLSDCPFTGQVPLELSNLTNLISLDLSFNNQLKLQNPNLPTLIQNLSNSLRQLSLDWIDLSADTQNHWAHALTVALPNLEVLSLCGCGLSGPIPHALSLLHSLSKLDLSENDLFTEVPEFLGNMSSLRSLSLSNCGLHGQFPKSLFLTLPTLLALDVSSNPNLTMVFPEDPKTTSLQILTLDLTNCPTTLQSSFTNFTSLKELRLFRCNLSGSISTFLAINNLSQIQNLDLSFNRLTGALPSSFGNELQSLHLSNNFLEGTVPPSLFSHSSLQVLYLANNQLSSWLDDLGNASSYVLTHIDLSNNKLHGLIPKSIFRLKNIEFLTLSDNNFSDNVELGRFLNLQHLTDLDLSCSGLSIIEGSTSATSVKTQAQLHYLNLQSCNLSEIPMLLQSQAHMSNLDLSNNKIQGKVPSWIWKIMDKSSSGLNFSNNLLESLEHLPSNFSFRQLEYVDLHSNKLQGSLPNFPISIPFQDYSHNKFTSTIPSNINFTSTRFYSLSHNRVSGKIPLAICNTHDLVVLDLSYNNFTSGIPKCLIEKMSNSLRVLNLRKNSFEGSLPQSFKAGCRLQTLNLHGNQLEGRLTPSLANCKKLEVIDVGNNQLQDTFPFWLENLPTLRVLILKSNKFYGQIVRSQIDYPLFSSLQIFDLSYNHFFGNLSALFFSKWKEMTGVDGSGLNSDNKTVAYFLNGGFVNYYQDTVAITMKGQDMELVKILNALTIVDLSNNKFKGEIPQSTGELRFLHVLNFSKNDFCGHIPTSFENLVHLESLDLSQNKLTGKIPWQLTKLTFLEVLNLSENLLIGEIPQSNQFLTFNNDSYLGNIGLCGPPLSAKCEDSKNNFNSSHMKGEEEIDRKRMWIGFGIGYGVGLGGILWTLVLWKEGCKRYNQFVDRILQWFLYKLNKGFYV